MNYGTSEFQPLPCGLHQQQGNTGEVCCCGRRYSFDNPLMSCEAYRKSTENLKSYMQRQWSLVGIKYRKIECEM